MTQTPNYDLNMFDSNDDMEENSRLGLNDNAGKIDTALKGLRDDVDDLSSPAAADVTYDNTISGLTATDVQAALDEELDKIDILSTDYVVEEGVDGIWNYRKWNSGIAECWGTETYNNVSCNTAWGNIFQSSFFGNVLFPFAFQSTPTIDVYCSAKTSSDYSCWFSFNASNPTTPTQTGAIIVLRGTSAVIPSVHVNYKAIGRWK